MEQCVEGSVKNGAAVGGAMMSLATALVAGHMVTTTQAHPLGSCVRECPRVSPLANQS